MHKCLVERQDMGFIGDDCLLYDAQKVEDRPWEEYDYDMF